MTSERIMSIPSITVQKSEGFARYEDIKPFSKMAQAKFQVLKVNKMKSEKEKKEDDQIFKMMTETNKSPLLGKQGSAAPGTSPDVAGKRRSLAPAGKRASV